MHNYLLLTVAILENQGLLSSSDAAKFAKELESVTLPDNYEAMSNMVKDLYKRLNITKVTAK